MKIKVALREYQKGYLTAWAAAAKAGVSLWEFLDELKRHNIYFATSQEVLREMLLKI
ncbi:MAG: UPF0175 family protein [Candidatus Micrarchaeota archaeon]